MNEHSTAVVAGVGAGLGAALCRALVHGGYRVAGLARSGAAGDELRQELGAGLTSFQCDLTDRQAVVDTLAEVSAAMGPVDVYIHNVAAFHQQEFTATPAAVFEDLWRTTCLAAVHGAQAVIPGMLERSRGVLLFIGATASVKPAAEFSAFGAAKFALRGLAQSLAREYGPRGIHVAHLVVDGVIWGPRARDDFGMAESQCLDPDAIARTCMHLVAQPRECWTHELDLRPAVERF